MATSSDYIQFVCDQIEGVGEIVSKKMFGEYLVYVDQRPIFCVCDNTVFVKQIPELTEILKNTPLQPPYNGAKLHYILDIDNGDQAISVARILKTVIPIPKPRKLKKRPNQ